MDNIHETNAGGYYIDFNWDEFVIKLFSLPPQNQFSFRIELLQTMDPNELPKLLGNMLVTGAKQLYNKQLAELIPEEIENLQNYYRSIGFELEYKSTKKIQYIPELKKTLPINHFQIDFKAMTIPPDILSKP